MSELAFFPPTHALTLAEIAARTGAGLAGDVDVSQVVTAAAALDRAGALDVTLLAGGQDPGDLAATRAGACFVARDHASEVPHGTIALIVERPIEAFALVAAALHPQSTAPAPLRPRGGIDSAAIVDGSASLETGVSVDPGAIIGAGAEIGAGTSVGANSVIGPGVRIGRGCVIDSHVSIRTALIGDRVVIQTGAKIGTLDPRTPKSPHLGRVIIQDDVEIGANAAVERGGLGDTTIGEGSRIAALVVVPAETTVGRHDVVDGRLFLSRENV